MHDKTWIASESLRRDLRLIDQTLTAFSILRDRYGRRATWLNVVLLVAGVGLLLLTFGADFVLAVVGVEGDSARLIVGLMGAVVFLVSLIEIRVNWQGKAALFGWAADRFAELKLNYATYLDGPKANAVREAELRRQYQSANAVAPRISDDLFLKLKQAHLRKIALSKMISRSPGTPLLFLRWELMRRGSFDE